MLGVLFQPDSPEARIQKRYLEQGEYDLCIDEGRQVTQLTSHGWRALQPGMKIVMRIVIEDFMPSWEIHWQYRCHFCKSRNEIENHRVSIHWLVLVSHWSWQRLTTESQQCGRRFQASGITRYYKEQDTNGEKTKRTNVATSQVTEVEMHLIRNFHLQYVRPFWNLVNNIDTKYEKVCALWSGVWSCLPKADVMTMSCSQEVCDLVF
jgi:hypothetical protein